MNERKQLFKGILLVIIGAASYGILATMVALAYQEGYSTTEVVTSQYLLGLAIMAVINLLVKKKKGQITTTTDKPTFVKLAVGGIAFGLIGYFYYLSVKYVPVSVAVVLLMQSIWISIVLETFITKKLPDIYKCIAVLTVILGTVFATNAINNLQNLDPKGIALGMGGGIMYAVMLLVMNSAATNMHPYKKSLWMLTFAGITVVVIGLFSLPPIFHFSIFWKWGLALAIFGPVLPMILLNMGMPKTGMGLGAILVSIEIPVSVFTAYVFLQEKVVPTQWMGIGVIILSVALINRKALKAKFR